MFEDIIKTIKLVVKKKVIKTYVIGGGIFTMSYLTIFFFIIALRTHDPENKFLEFILEILYLVYAPARIKANNCMSLVSIYTYLFLLGGMLSLIATYGYCKRGTNSGVNPISKKSLFIAIAVFVIFAWLLRMITLPTMY